MIVLFLLKFLVDDDFDQFLYFDVLDSFFALYFDFDFDFLFFDFDVLDYDFDVLDFDFEDCFDFDVLDFDFVDYFDFGAGVDLRADVVHVVD